MYASPCSFANAAGRMTDYETTRRKEGVMNKIKLPSHHFLASIQSKEPRAAMMEPALPDPIKRNDPGAVNCVPKLGRISKD